MQGSYSSLSTMSAPLDMSFSKIRDHDSSCAFPSWPRRSSLSDSEHEEPQATSYVSDDDLYFSSPFDDDNGSVSSGSSSPSPNPAMTGFVVAPPPMVDEQEFLRRECERVAMQKEYLRQVKAEKERRRQLALRARKSSPKKSPKNKPAALTTITESGE
ncbi:hypothetical protein E4U42_006553 [Claviceps africana]|uniref:Uncharacterized protein n=1 Tax=Claviceps africana TaxID=83212 RepID=A0A8K0J2U4_9HYPO|nr:hypothetical protein E4U42_006553 [Claviceps africana]